MTSLRAEFPCSLLYTLCARNMSMWLLLDGAHWTNPLRVLYTIDNMREYIPLFIGTRYADLLSVSPLLVKVRADSPLLKWFLDDHSQEAGLLFWSKSAPEVIAAGLRRTLGVTMPGGNQAMLRYYDPQIFTDLIRLECREIIGCITEHMDFFAVDVCDMENVNVWIHGIRTCPPVKDRIEKFSFDAECCDVLEDINEKRMILHHIAEVQKVLHRKPVSITEYSLAEALPEFQLRAYPAPCAHRPSIEEYRLTYERLARHERAFGITTEQDLFAVDLLLETAEEHIRPGYIAILSDTARPLSLRLQQCKKRNKED